MEQPLLMLVVFHSVHESKCVLPMSDGETRIAATFFYKETIMLHYYIIYILCYVLATKIGVAINNKYITGDIVVLLIIILLG